MRNKSHQIVLFRKTNINMQYINIEQNTLLFIFLIFGIFIFFFTARDFSLLNGLGRLSVSVSRCCFFLFLFFLTNFFSRLLKFINSRLFGYRMFPG